MKKELTKEQEKAFAKYCKEIETRSAMLFWLGYDYGISNQTKKIREVLSGFSASDLRRMLGPDAYLKIYSDCEE